MDDVKTEASVFDRDEHQPLAESDAHGTVTPKSAPPAQTQSGDPLDTAKAAEKSE